MGDTGQWVANIISPICVMASQCVNYYYGNRRQPKLNPFISERVEIATSTSLSSITPIISILLSLVAGR